MTKLQWLILWLIFLGYLGLGAFIFYQIERKLEESLYAQELKDIEDPANKIQGKIGYFLGLTNLSDAVVRLRNGRTRTSQLIGLKYKEKSQ